MIKLLFITDTHGRATSPKARLDNFPETLLDKLRWVGEYAVENDIDGVIHGGDWLESPDVSEAYISEIVKVLKEYPCPIATVVGNHDIYGYNPDTFRRTPLGIAEASGVIERLYSKVPFIIEKEGEVAVLTGQDAIHDLDKGTDYYYTDSYAHDEYHGKPCINIHTVHGMLVAKDWPMVNCTVIDDIAHKCNADIILTGHEHTGYGVVDKVETIFCNPGSLSRVTAAVGDVRRDVRMAEISIDGELFDIKLINLPGDIAKSSNLVIDRDRLVQEKSAKENLNKFIENINRGQVKKGINIFDAADTLGDELQIDKMVVEKAKLALSKAEEELKEGDK